MKKKFKKTASMAVAAVLALSSSITVLAAPEVI